MQPVASEKTPALTQTVVATSTAEATEFAAATSSSAVRSALLLADPQLKLRADRRHGSRFVRTFGKRVCTDRASRPSCSDQPDAVSARRVNAVCPRSASDWRPSSSSSIIGR